MIVRLFLMMMKSLTPQEERVITKFKARVKEALGKSLVSFTLFGSRARGEGDEESDVDILVLIKKLNNRDRKMVIGIASDLFLETEIEISPSVLSQDQFEKLKQRERLIAFEIERDGIPL